MSNPILNRKQYDYYVHPTAGVGDFSLVSSAFNQSILGDATTRFDITNTAGTTYRYTYDGTGTDPLIVSKVKIGKKIRIQGTFNAGNIGLFTVTGVGVNYFEITNAAGVAENDKIIGADAFGVNHWINILNSYFIEGTAGAYSESANVCMPAGCNVYWNDVTVNFADGYGYLGRYVISGNWFGRVKFTGKGCLVYGAANQYCLFNADTNYYVEGLNAKNCFIDIVATDNSSATTFWQAVSISAWQYYSKYNIYIHDFTHATTYASGQVVYINVNYCNDIKIQVKNVSVKINQDGASLVGLASCRYCDIDVLLNTLTNNLNQKTYGLSINDTYAMSVRVDVDTITNNGATTAYGVYSTGATKASIFGSTQNSESNYTGNSNSAALMST